MKTTKFTYLKIYQVNSDIKKKYRRDWGCRQSISSSLCSCIPTRIYDILWYQNIVYRCRWSNPINNLILQTKHTWFSMSYVRLSISYQRFNNVITYVRLGIPYVWLSIIAQTTKYILYICLVSRMHDLVFRMYNLVSRTHDFLSRKYNLVSRTHDLSFRKYNIVSRTHGLVSRKYNLVSRTHGLVSRKYNLVSRRHDLGSRKYNLVSRRYDLGSRKYNWHQHSF